MPTDHAVRRQVAEWSVAAWADLFPDDDVGTYLDLYTRISATGLPRVWISVDEEGALTGTASLVDDDDLPAAPEPGPWLAAVWVEPTHRKKGDASRLVATAIHEARQAGHRAVYLYTHGAVEWYERMGWRTLRCDAINGVVVTVMCLDLA